MNVPDAGLTTFPAGTRFTAMRTIHERSTASHAGSLFWLQSQADQIATIRRLAAQRMNAATIASIVKLSAAEVSRIIEARE